MKRLSLIFFMVVVVSCFAGMDCMAKKKSSIKPKSTSYNYTWLDSAYDYKHYRRGKVFKIYLRQGYRAKQKDNQENKRYSGKWRALRGLLLK